MRPVFDFRGAGDVVGFGTALTLCQLFWIVQSQADIVIAGRAFSPHELGLYSEALFLVLIFTGRFLPPLNEVAFPAYAELRNAGQSIAPAFVSGVRMIMLIAAPFYIGLSLVAAPLVATFFGPKWLEMIPVVAGLAAIMPLMALQIVCSPATNALGRPGIYVATSACGAIIMPLCFWYGSRNGAEGLVMAWHIAAPLLLAVTLALTLPAVGARLRDLAAALLPVVTGCAAMTIGVVALTPYLRPLPALVELLALAGVLAADPAANAASGLPLNGRKVAQYRAGLVSSHGLFGDLYALSGDFVRRLRASGIRLPEDLIGDDSLVGALAKTNLMGEGEWREDRVRPCPAAGFLCEPTDWASPASLGNQYRRMINYSVRHFQNRIVSAIMRGEGPSALPARLADLYGEWLPRFTPRLNPAWWWFDRQALARMRLSA